MEDIAKHSLHSTLRENIIEHLFAGELLKRLWQRDIVDAEILKSEFDAGGYDLVLTRGQITRHIQLKVSRSGGRRVEINVNRRLAVKPSGCVVWIIVDDDLNIEAFRWFGNPPGHALPDVSHMKTAKHTKGDANGVKALRDGHRLIRQKEFRLVDGIDGLLEALLGDALLKTTASTEAF